MVAMFPAMPLYPMLIPVAAAAVVPIWRRRRWTSRPRPRGMCWWCRWERCWRTAFDTDLRQVDFADEPATTKAINAVVAHDTRGLINFGPGAA
jgi:hypothetical protein